MEHTSNSRKPKSLRNTQQHPTSLFVIRQQQQYDLLSKPTVDELHPNSIGHIDGPSDAAGNNSVRPKKQTRHSQQLHVRPMSVFMARQQQQFQWLSKPQQKQQETQMAGYKQIIRGRQNNHKKILHQNRRILKQENYNQKRRHAIFSQHRYRYSPSEEETIVLDYLQKLMHCLSQIPDDFELNATRFYSNFEAFQNNEYVLSVAMEDIFQKSLQNPNFRSTGAKLYNLLHMLNLNCDSLFQTMLKCKLDDHQQEVIHYMQSGQPRKVSETVLFLAELYSLLRRDNSPIQMIAENLISLQLLLLSSNAYSLYDVNCVCQTLILAGHDLVVDCGAEMQLLMEQLEAIKTTTAKFEFINCVLKLHRNNWRRIVFVEEEDYEEEEDEEEKDEEEDEDEEEEKKKEKTDIYALLSGRTGAKSCSTIWKFLFVLFFAYLTAAIVGYFVSL